LDLLAQGWEVDIDMRWLFLARLFWHVRGLWCRVISDVVGGIKEGLEVVGAVGLEKGFGAVSGEEVFRYLRGCTGAGV